ncbi:hypothetical protein EJD97_013824 [Solanum chilense]|uniref:Uncharacterized protein n=1 Tax=Solanum chilense TaxID=4083 RepID=A0A6N2BD74_SOLCI|nr:hypothetical protein EJD97_013824 [Solanum chilense]
MAKIATSHTSSSFLNNFFVPKLNEKGKFLFRQRRLQQLIVKSQIIDNATTYTCRISTDIPLYENPRACFDRYLENKPRVFKAIFPDKRRSHQLNQMRCKTKGVEYPPGVPNTVSKVLELDIIRWELQGLDDVLKPSEFSLGVKGSLYPDRNGPRTRLKGQLQMSISFVLPHVLALVPEAVRRDVAESVLRGLLQNMKSKVNGSLLTDYAEFKREMQNNLLV